MKCKSFISFANGQKYPIRASGKTAFRDLKVCEGCKIKDSCKASKALLGAQFEKLKERNIMAKVNGTKVWTNEVTIAFPALLEPKENSLNGNMEYTAMILIDKKDNETMEAIKQAIENAKLVGKDSKWKGKIPFNLSIKEPRDGDGLNNEGEKHKEYCHGKFFFSVSSRTQPLVVDRDRMPIVKEEDLVSGFKAIAILNFAPYDSNANKGVSVYLGGVQKIGDGTPIGGNSVTINDFEPLDDDEMF